MEKLRIDGYIGKDDGMSMIFGGAPNVSLRYVSDYLANLPDGTTELTVEINSGGGEVNEGFAIHDKLTSSGLTIHTEILGLCGSIATVIALSARPENRSMHENSEYFIHNPFWQPMGPDAMEADDLQRLAEDLRNSQEKILDFYVNKTGESKKTLKGLMEDAKGISARDAKKLGFVGKVITEAANERKYRIAAFIDPAKKTKTPDMEFSATQKSWIEQKFTDFAAKFDNLFKPVFIKAMKLELESGGTIETEGEGDLKGQKAFVVDADGNKTPATDGEHKLKDGKTIVVKDGTITDVKEAMPPTDEVANLKAKVTELETQLANTKTEADTAKAEKEKQEAAIVAMKKDIDGFKAMVLGNDIPPPAGQHFSGSNPQVNKTQAQILKEYRDSKNQKPTEKK